MRPRSIPGRIDSQLHNMLGFALKPENSPVEIRYIITTRGPRSRQVSDHPTTSDPIYDPIEEGDVHQHVLWLIRFVEKDALKTPPTGERVLGWMCGIGLPPVNEEMAYL